MAKVKIEVYSGINAGGGGCSCGCTSCTPKDVKAEYEAMKSVLLNKFEGVDLEFQYVDTEASSLSQYQEVEKVVQAGYQFPITLVNGVPRWAGGMPIDSMTEVILEVINAPQ